MPLPWRMPVRPLALRLLTCAWQEIGQEWAFNLRSPHWRLYRNQAAGASIAGDGWRVDLPAGRLCLLPDWVDCQSRCRSRTGHLYLHFDPRGLDGAWRGPALRRAILLPPSPEFEARAAALEASGPAPGNHLHALALVADVLALVLDDLPAASRAALAQHLDGPDPVASALRAIEGDVARAWTLAELARVCNLSPDHFGRVFRARLGRTPHRHVLERRIARAAESLAATDDAIEAVAGSCGFADRFHFTRVFTRLMGVAPAAWRRMQRRPREG